MSDPVNGDLSKGLIGYAVLRANFDHAQPSYIQNFNSFVLDVIARAHPQALQEAAIAERIRTEFGLTIPDRVVGSLLKGLIQRGSVLSVQNSFRLTDAALASAPDLGSEIARLERQQHELLTKFAAFVELISPKHADEFTTAVLARSLQTFIEQNAVPLLTRAVRPSTRHTALASKDEQEDSKYLVAAFLEHMYETDGVAFGYVVDSVKGAMLAAVFEMGTGNLSQKLDKVHIVLDTPVILKGLGYQGEQQQRAVQQTLDLAHRLGARVECFEHTTREVDGVLESAQAALRSLGRSQGHLREVDSHFLESGMSPADIEVLRDQLETNLRTLGVAVIDRPDDYYKYGLDEDALDSLLQESVGYRSEATRRYDVDSLSAVHRLRKGSSPRDFLRCRFVLVTDNVKLARASRRVEAKRHEWPLAMLDGDLAALLWVRSPAVAEDLPRQQLIATAFAGMQPSGYLWSKYLDEVSRLQERGEVSTDEAIILRARPEARRALMNATLGAESEVSADIVQAVVGKVRSEIAEPYRHQAAQAVADREKAVADAAEVNASERTMAAKLHASEAAAAELSTRLGSVEGDLQALRQRDTDRRDRIMNAARERARNTVRAVFIVVSVLLIAASIGDLAHPKWLKSSPTWLAVLLLVLGAILAFVTALRSLIGGSVREWFQPMEGALAKRIERRNLQKAGLDQR